MKVPALLAAASLGILALPTVAAPRNLNACGEIAAPGAYVITRNIDARGDCLVITADNVTVDLNGFVIAGDRTGNGINIVGNGVTVRNGTVTGFGFGIFRVTRDPVDVPGTVIERMHVTNNVGVGIGGGSAIVRDSVVNGNGNTGIAVGAPGSQVVNNRVVGNRGGIAVGQGGIASGNVVMNNDLSGIVATCPALVIGNAVTGTPSFPSPTGPTSNIVLNGSGCVVEHNVAP